METGLFEDERATRNWTIGLAAVSVSGFLILGRQHLHVLRMPTSRIEAVIALLYALYAFLLGASILCTTDVRRRRLSRQGSALVTVGRVLGLCIWAAAITVGLASLFLILPDKHLRLEPDSGANCAVGWYIGLPLGAIVACYFIVQISDLRRIRCLRKFFCGESWWEKRQRKRRSGSK